MEFSQEVYMGYVTFGSILGATVSECLFRVVIGAHASDAASSIFFSLQGSNF